MAHVTWACRARAGRMLRRSATTAFTLIVPADIVLRTDFDSHVSPSPHPRRRSSPRRCRRRHRAAAYADCRDGEPSGLLFPSDTHSTCARPRGDLSLWTPFASHASVTTAFVPFGSGDSRQHEAEHRWLLGPCPPQRCTLLCTVHEHVSLCWKWLLRRWWSWQSIHILHCGDRLFRLWPKGLHLFIHVP